MEICREWAVEVDQNRERYNLGPQEKFIVEFIGSLYARIEAGDITLSKIQSMHFTRIFHPDRDDIGAYVRLRIFADDQELHDIDQEIDSRLKASAQSGNVFKVKKKDLNWEKCAENYGGTEVASLFRDYLDSISRISYKLLYKKQQGFDVEKVLWPWTHFFFNASRGYGRSVIELAQGAVTGFLPNI
jgi:hypothetical protein